MGKSIFEQQRQPAAGPFDLLQFVPQLSANPAELTRLQQTGARLMRDMRDDGAAAHDRRAEQGGRRLQHAGTG